jgi:hypothetical protein
MGVANVAGYKTVRELAGGTVIDVQYVSFTSTPSGFGASYAIPFDSWVAGGPGHALLQVIADELETLGANHHMTGSTGVQDLDANGLLADFVDATVTYMNGALVLTTSVLIPVQAFFAAEPGIGGLTFTTSGGQSPADQCDAAYADLEHLANG